MQRSLIRRSINATFHMNILKEKRGVTTLTEEEKTVSNFQSTFYKPPKFVFWGEIEMEDFFSHIKTLNLKLLTLSLTMKN